MTVVAQCLPGVADDQVWQVRRPTDPAACALADRHYSRRKSSIGSGRVGGPMRRLVLVSPCGRAVWVTTWAKWSQDGLDAWRCSVFRNEGAGLSSELILAAEEITAELWIGRPADGWVTYVDTAKVHGPNPGYCFKRAGWSIDRSYVPRRQAPTLIRLRKRGPA